MRAGDKEHHRAGERVERLEPTVLVHRDPAEGREVELLGMAGLSNAEALAAATSVPARMLGLDAEIGSIAVGMKADLVVLADDPLQDLAALRSILWTVKDGVVRTPTGWMLGP